MAQIWIVRVMLCIQSLAVATRADAQHYREYHEAVNRAEVHFVQGHTDSALKLYRQAFREYDFVFIKDAVIAAQIALHDKRYAQADSFLLKGAANGLQIACLDKIPLLHDYLKKDRSRGLRDRMKAMDGASERLLHPGLAKEWAERFNEEQTAKNQPGGFDHYRDVVLRNVEAIRKLWATKQLYPGDRAIGPGRCTDMGNMYAFYSLAHYDCAASSNSDMLWAAVEAGMLHPRDFATIWEFERLRNENVPASQRTNPGCRPEIKKFNLSWFHENDSASMAEVRRNRSRYWIRSVETEAALKKLEKTGGYQLRFGYR